MRRRPRMPGRTDDGGSMPLALLVAVVGVMLSGVLATTVAVQTDSSRQATGRQRAVEAAEAGLAVAVGQIRAATDGTDSNGVDTNGMLSKLPCGPLTGAVGTGGTGGYIVTIVYTSTRGGAAIPCRGPKGPAYAEFTSRGTDASSGRVRTLQARYAFRTTVRNIAGGLFRVYRTAASKDLCLHGIGSSVTVRQCTAGSVAQTFAYNPDLTITLVSSITDGTPRGRCLDAGAVPHVANTTVTLQPCGATTQVRQQWSFNDHGNLEGTNDGTTTNGHCVNVVFPDTVGSSLVLKTGTGCGQSYTNQQNYDPDPEVGAGAAGKRSGQLVNVKLFARCLDVTESDWTRGYLTAWPCQQKPDANAVGWKQKWTTPALAAGAAAATGSISTQPNNTAFRTCLTSPATTGATAYVHLSQCPVGVLPASMQWTVNGDTGVAATSHTIVSSAGNCMAAADPDDPATVFHPGGLRITRIIVVPCNGNALQKWNADPYVLRPKPLTDISEQ